MSVHWEPLEKVTSIRKMNNERCNCGKPGEYHGWGFGKKAESFCSTHAQAIPLEEFGGMNRYSSEVSDG